ncbi:non-hydrolyzing UDP-N-acetylglucosamine 2-epimerase [Streptacidiphilus sp. PAMC 29251]
MPSRSGGGTAVVLGTRPELIKLAPVMRELTGRVRLLHTGQHYDSQLSGAFLEEYGLPEPERTFTVGGLPRTAQIAAAARELDTLFAEDPPQAVVVQGDTNATLSGALAANGRGIPLVHVEAGLRSFDRRMPEEHNRVLTDHLADLLCAATGANAANLRAEGIDPELIRVTGNTVVEAARAMLPGPEQRAAYLTQRGLRADDYILVTLHRPENTDDPDILATILTELDALVTPDRPVLLPLHPRTQAAAREHGLAPLLSRLTVTEPLGHEEFLSLLAQAALVVSDSGGVQEEVTVFKRPLIVVRRSTERPESMPDFARLVPPGPGIGAVARDWLADLPALHARLAALPCPYGDGGSGRRIAELVEDLIASGPLT